MYEKVLKHHEPTRKYKSKPGATISHLSELLSSKSLQETSVGGDAEKREPLYTVGENVNWCSHYGKQYESSLKF